ncbi:MAG: phytoene desaturase family protein [Beijerinckiaceae bacterium]|nr:phytoene desaturase family protein [Beijerinckiaceae bacterium]MCZ8301417.1 phytoene desaturase family protein [Beijerinckiaceae bacterium]
MWQPEPPKSALAAGTRDARPHAVIVGAGLGGLAAGIRLGARGYRVTLVDALAEPGGRAAPWRQDGFLFDAGPTIITAPFLLEELWALCGRRMADDITLKPMDPFYRLDFADGSSLECNGDMAAMRARIRALCPGDEAGYLRFMAESEAIYRIGFEELSAVPFTKLTDMLKVLPDMVRMRADRSLYRLAAKHVKDERLRTALSFHPLFIGGNPFDVTSVYGLILHLEKTHGVHYVMGGTAALVQGLVNLLHRQGATFRMNSPVQAIEVDSGRASGIRLAGGERIEADIVVSNACIGHTYDTLLAGVKRKRWTSAKLRRTRFSMGVFVWYFGTNRRYEAVPHHTIQLGPRYRGLLDDIFHKKIVAEDFSLYLHRPSATDPSVAPPGHDAFYALVPVPNLQGGQDWASLAEPFRQRIARHLEATLLPGLSDSVVSSHMITPLDFETRLRSKAGAAFGPEPLLFQSAYFRPHNVSEEVPNLYLVGAGTHPGAGVPGVLCSARILDEVVPHAADA